MILNQVFYQNLNVILFFQKNLLNFCFWTLIGKYYCIHYFYVSLGDLIEVNKFVTIELSFNPFSIFVKIFSSTMPTILVDIALVSTSTFVHYYSFMSTIYSILPLSLDYSSLIEINNLSVTMLLPFKPRSNVFHVFISKKVFSMTLKNIIFYLTFKNISIIIMNRTLTLISVIFYLSFIKGVFLKLIHTISINDTIL